MPRSPVLSPSITFAKFSRPRLYDVLRRERLFARLDAARAHPSVWIAGPPGSGKSTLIASYVEARRVPGAWFQADACDADPGTFFHYLTLAATDVVHAKPKQLASLARFGPECAAELPSFTRRFLRAFFALFPAQSLIVIDNFHEAPATAAWRPVLARGRALEAEHAFAAARALYERALELANPAEAVYRRRLMICQRELGDPAGALTTYRRCRELLSIVLARKPAPETEAIRATLDRVSN